MVDSLKLTLAQINPTVGDIAGNAVLIEKAYKQAKNAELVVFPELAITGYPPEDLVLMPQFRKDAMQATETLAKLTKGGPAMLVGGVWEHYNAALLLDDGKIAHIQRKTMLPNYGVFDEKRIFTPGDGAKPVAWRGKKLGILICEDMWWPEMAKDLSGVDTVIVINASPFEGGKLAQRHEAAATIARAASAPLVYVNMIGGQDDIVFDGGSFAMDASGKITAQLAQFEEIVTGQFTQHPALSTEHSLWQAMKLGLSDYVRKNGFEKVLVGLSGGIDSALTAALAVDALGAANVKGAMLPSPYTSHESVDDALLLAKNLGIETMTIPITPAMQTFDEVLSPAFKTSDWMENVAVGGNLQARLRGLTLMALSNQFGWLLLSTGNKSEIATGYTTLYGDSCGGYNVLKDLYKTQIYALARGCDAIPKRILTKPPSAELKPGQTDQDTLPPYETLDAILALHLEGQFSAREIIAKGYDKATVEKVLRMVRLSEYKRRQSAPGVKLSPMLFSKDRRYPLTNRWE